MKKFPWAYLRCLFKAALAEDIGSGDVTTRALIPDGRMACARLICKRQTVICGLPLLQPLLRLLSPRIHVQRRKCEGAWCAPGAVVAVLRGPAAPLLQAERVMLNLLQRLAGIATATRLAAQKCQTGGVQLLDTRKTTPLLRWLEKYAVRVGGGCNHRMGLYDMYLIKDNHLQAAGGIARAIALCRKHQCPGLKLGVEVRTVAEFLTAWNLKVDHILLDNFTPQQIRALLRQVPAARPRGRRPALEASGNISLKNLSAYARSGVDYISMGWLTHSAPAADLSLLFA